MNTQSTRKPRKRTTAETIIGAISAGTALILIGAVYVAALPNSLWEKTVAFFSSFNVTTVPSTEIQLPAPTELGTHTVVYNAAFQFCIGIAILQIIILALRILWRSPIDKTSETVGNLVFWFGACYLVPTFLNSATIPATWFGFWAALIIVIGISLIARAVVYLAKNLLK